MVIRQGLVLVVWLLAESSILSNPIIPKSICLSPEGCKINLQTGECKTCIEIRQKTIIPKKKQEITCNKPTKRTPIDATPKTKRCYWKCVIGPCDDGMLPPGCVWIDTWLKMGVVFLGVSCILKLRNRPLYFSGESTWHKASPEDHDPIVSNFT